MEKKITQNEKLSSQPAINGGHSIPNVNGLASRSDPPQSWASASNINHHVSDGSSSSNLLGPQSLPRGPQPLQIPPLSQTEKMKMNERALKTVVEVIRLIRAKEPLWIKSPVDGRLVIDEAVYKKFFPSTDCPTVRIESSKEVVVVQMDTTNLLKMLLNTDNWARSFPTIVNQAKTIHVLESMHSYGIRSKLIYEQLHILSTLVLPREFTILRTCKQMEENLWLIADVSYNLPYNIPFEFGAPTCFKRPSGCLIQALPNGFSKVTWMEHVEVDDKVPPHELYKDLLYGGSGFGALRWTTTLKRMCERLTLSSISDFPTTDHGGELVTIEGRRCIMSFGERMLREFAKILKMSNKLDFSKLSHTNVRVLVRGNIEAGGTPNGIIVCASSSLCLPIPPPRVYNFLNDLDIRHQWEILCHGDPVDEAIRLTTGTDHRNCVTILQPSTTTETTRELRIIQESFIDELGGMMVYTPSNLDTVNSIVSGQVDPSNILILPSGFAISRDGRSSATDLPSGSDYSKTLLTMVFQLFVRGPDYSEHVAGIHPLLSSTIQRIKVMLNCDDTHQSVIEQRSENDVIEQTLKNGVCPPCGSSKIGKEEHERSLKKLRLDNAFLKQKDEKLSSQRAIHGGHSIPNVDGLASRCDPLPSLASASNINRHVSYGSSSNHLLRPQSLPRGPQPLQLPQLSQTEKMKMNERAVNAMTEVIRLIGAEEPLWIKSPIDGRLVIDEAIYKKFFTNTDCPRVRIESSKEVVVVQMDATNLIRMFFNPEKWERLFPTIVNKAKGIHLLESMQTQGRTQGILIYENLHILSPLVQPREFMIIRSLQRKEENVWVIADVSYNLSYFPFEFGAPTCFKRPSGYLIQGLPNGYSKVTWMEHVEVDDKVPPHQLYKDLLFGGSGFGALRWTTTLKRMCERLSLSSISDFPITNHGGGTIEGRRCIMALGERMMRDFAGILEVSYKLDFSQMSISENGVGVLVRQNRGAGTPKGDIACASSSFRLPIPPLQLFNFRNNLDVRHLWEILCHGKSYDEAVRFTTGTDNRNCVTILQPATAMKETRELRIIQDSCIDALGGMMVYAPLPLDTANSVVSGQVNPSIVRILPSGFIISHDGRSSAADLPNDGDSLLTVAIQILVRGPSYSEDAACVRELFMSTVQRIKAMLNCDDAHQ